MSLSGKSSANEKRQESNQGVVGSLSLTRAATVSAKVAGLLAAAAVVSAPLLTSGRDSPSGARPPAFNREVRRRYHIVDCRINQLKCNRAVATKDNNIDIRCGANTQGSDLGLCRPVDR